MNRFLTAMVIFFVFNSCRETMIERPQTIVHDWAFDEDAGGWAGDFSDYPVGEEEFFELEFSYRQLPAPLDTMESGLMLTGANRSDDLFMYIKRRITGLLPEQVYHVTFIVEFASNVPDGRVGIGGSPGESVYIKAGATGIEPDKIVDDMNYYRMNIDKGNQSQGGTDMIVIGDFSNDTDRQEYTLKEISNDEQGFPVLSNEAGELWIIFGTDSGFEGTTTIYYNYIRVELLQQT